MIGYLVSQRNNARVVTFTVHEPPGHPVDRIERADAMEFVKDGFSFSAALFAPLWLLAQRHWLALGAYVASVAAIAAVVAAFGVSWQWDSLFVAAVHAIVGYEAGELRRQALTAKGWETLGSVTGRNLAECERRFFEGWLPNQPVFRFQSAQPASNAQTQAPPGASAAEPAPAVPMWRRVLGGVARARTNA